MQMVSQKGIWNPTSLKWESRMVELPVFNDGTTDKPIIFVPKRFVSRASDANSVFSCFFRFARNYILANTTSNFLRGVPRRGRGGSILKKDFDASLGIRKSELTKWLLTYPEIVKDYWVVSLAKIRPMTDQEIEQIVY